MKKDCITTHAPQQPKIQTAQGWQQMIVKEKRSNIGSKEMESRIQGKETKGKEKKTTAHPTQKSSK